MGYTNSDGSALSGGLNPSGVGQAFKVDSLGNLIVNPGGAGSSSDGTLAASIGEEALAVYNSGGPVLVNGVPSGLAFDRLRSWLGKGSQTNSITATSVGDTQLTFSVAPKTIEPGQPIKLSGGATAEYVYVASTFVPSPTATTVPLASPVVNAGQTSASWDVFNVAGPANGSITPAGTIMAVNVVLDVATGNLYAMQSFRGVTDVNVGGRTSTAIAAGGSANIKSSPGRLARVIVTGGTISAALTFYDNSSGGATGTIIGVIPSTATIGQIYDFQMPALVGISAVGAAGSPAVTVGFY